ncbi:MAG: hypothetical protein AAGA99_26565 [Actinomycetota bacterium]
MTEPPPIPAPSPADHAEPKRWFAHSIAKLADHHGHQLDAEAGRALVRELDSHRTGRHQMTLEQIHHALLASIGYDTAWPTLARLRELLRWARPEQPPPDQAQRDEAHAELDQAREQLERRGARRRYANLPLYEATS